MQIGFFDSGIGGLTVLHQAKRAMPQEDYLYYADTDHVPYGRKTKEEIKQYVQEAVDFIAEQGVKALVVACNTATSVAIKDLRARYSFPILGMEPAVKPAVNDTHCTKRILVTATPVTIREEKLQNLLHQVDQHHQVDLLPLPRLVEFAEQGNFTDGQAEAYLRETLSAFDLEPSGEISLLDIYRIMEHETPLLHLDTHTNPDCREGVHIQHALQEQYDALQNAFESRMAQVSLQDIMDRFEERRTQTRGH